MGAPYVPIKLDRLAEVIETAPDKGFAARVDRDWLQRVRLEILEGRAIKAELAAAGLFDEICQAVQNGPKA